MGWASLLEDIVDRNTSELHNIKSSITATPDGSSSYPDNYRRLQELVSAVDGLLRLIRENLEVATNPEMDLVFELSQLKSENEKLKQDIIFLGEQNLKLIQAKKANKLLGLRIESTQIPSPKPSPITKSNHSNREIPQYPFCPPFVVCDYCGVKVKKKKYSSHVKNTHTKSTDRKEKIAPVKPQKVNAGSENRGENHQPTSSIGTFNGIKLITLTPRVLKS